MRRVWPKGHQRLFDVEPISDPQNKNLTITKVASFCAKIEWSRGFDQFAKECGVVISSRQIGIQTRAGGQTTRDYHLVRCNYHPDESLPYVRPLSVPNLLGALGRMKYLDCQDRELFAAAREFPRPRDTSTRIWSLDPLGRYNQSRIEYHENGGWHFFNEITLVNFLRAADLILVRKP